MDGDRFDAVARLFAERRAGRRAALYRLGAGGAVALASAAGFHRAVAQKATPAPKGNAKSEFLFVQSFHSGSFTPQADSTDNFTLTLNKDLGQTVFFSDRPARVVGGVSTPAFFQGMPFGTDNPPNAALVLEAGPGDTDVVVMELTAPAYDEATHTATYQAKVLTDYEKLGATFQEEPKAPGEVHAAFGAASLFIDDCPDGCVTCYQGSLNGEAVGELDDIGMCWSWKTIGCHWCRDNYDDECNSKFSACKGQCVSACCGSMC
ncbi:MAG TPA: hypothetical protein VH482_22020 [Thermomicrobiales bacterium]|jgi:hypothetical protein